jgi:hypothetical protein
MPGRAMTYKFLNTIIDDLFSFIIIMPTLHRLSCFRDDIIFVIYVYQRWIYRVDKTRGMWATERKEDKKKVEEAGIEDTTENKAIEEEKPEE